MPRPFILEFVGPDSSPFVTPALVKPATLEARSKTRRISARAGVGQKPPAPPASPVHVEFDLDAVRQPDEFRPHGRHAVMSQFPQDFARVEVGSAVSRRSRHADDSAILAGLVHISRWSI